MARLPSERYLVQSQGDQVVLFEDYTERELVRVTASDGNAMAMAQKAVYDAEDLSPEDKCFAHFWFGYFWAFASYPEMPVPELFRSGWPKSGEGDGLVKPQRLSDKTAADIGYTGTETLWGQPDEAEAAHEAAADRQDRDGLLPGEAPF